MDSEESCERTRPLQGSLASRADQQTRDAVYIKAPDALLAETLGLTATPTSLGEGGQDPYLLPDSAIAEVSTRLHVALRRQSCTSSDDEDHGAEYDPAALISRDIKLTTTMDLLKAREVPLQPSFSFFVESVDCPIITPYDAHNWRVAKCYMAELGTHDNVVGSAIIALSTLYKGLHYGLPLSRAISFYQSSRRAYENAVDDKGQDFGAFVVATFLLCIFDLLHQETVPVLESPSEALVRKFEAGLNTTSKNRNTSEQTARILSWLRLVHASSLRAGSNGLISDSLPVFSPYHASQAVPPPKSHSLSYASIYAMLHHPIFEFYLQLQIISGQIAKLTHYHRSRTTGADQQEVTEEMLHFRSRLLALWESRSALQRQGPEDLRAKLASDIAEPLITLIGLCTAAYHAEFVEMDRVLGDPICRSTGSKQAMEAIKEIVDGDWNCYHDGRLNSGFLRPLFLYAIECMDRDETQWAVERMVRIKDPICRSDFFAEFGLRLSEAQLGNERRVTSKYFCIWYFGVPPPFM